MTSLLVSLNLLSFRQSEIVHSNEIDCVKVSSKNVCVQGLYGDAKSEFFQSRCSECKEQWRWRKNKRCFEKLFRSYRCIFSSWEFNHPLLIFFSNGSISSIELNNANNTLKSIDIDDSLTGKFLPSRIVDAVVCQNYIFVTYSEPKLTFIVINHESPSFPAKIFGRKRGKVVGFEPKITHIDLIGPASKNLERKLSLNSCKDHLLIWWRFSGDDVWPWTPAAYATDRINMLIYKFNFCLEILCTVKVNGELISAKYSNQHSNKILALEELRSEKDICINVSVYEIIREQCHHAFMSKLPLQGKILSFDWSPTDKLLIADSNSLLLIYDLKKKASLVTNLLIIPKRMIWHPQDCIAIVTGTNGQVQCFDTALTCISFKIYHKTFVNFKVLDLNSHFAQSFSILKLLWQRSNFNDSCLFLLDSDMMSFLILKFSFGSITRNNLTPLELISQYLKSNSIDESVSLLRSLNWWHANELHFQCLVKVANFFLRKPLNFQTEAALELTLGTFYKNIDILPKRFVKLYEHKVHHIARRFFHHLLRYHQLRKAFMLAIDLESQDLFLDLSHVAKAKEENILALVAIHKANELNGSETSYSESSCSSESVTESSSASDYENSNWEKITDPHVQVKENSFLGGSSDHQYWIPVADKSKLTKSWLNSSRMDDGAHLSYSKEQPTCNFISSISYGSNESHCQNHIMYSDINNATTSSENCQLRVIPTLSCRPLPDLPSYPKHPESYLNTDDPSQTAKQTRNVHFSDKSKEFISSSYLNKSISDEIEEVEDSKIKHVHFGII